MRLRAVLALACGFIAAPVVAAGHASADPASCDGAGCVPYVAHNVTQGAECSVRTRYDFGVDSSGATFLCDSDNKWAASKQLIGVRTLGAPCDGSGGAAQSPDGIPMTCPGQGQGWLADYSVIYSTNTF
jgi:hypothetical protein